MALTSAINTNGWLQGLTWSTRLSILLLLVSTLIPLIQSGHWYIRLFDFPRMQLLSLALVPFALSVLSGIWSGWRPEIWFWWALLAGITAWQAGHIAKYTAPWPSTLAFSERSNLTVFVANLDYENTDHAAVQSVLAQKNADLLLLIELDQTWAQALKDTRQRYPYHVEAVAEKGLGMALWSRLPLRQADVKYLVSQDRPSIHAQCQIDEGTWFNFVGLHPTPPGLPKRAGEGRHDSHLRDAELILVARQIADQPRQTWVVAGDFNDVAWSHTTRLFERLSGLKDPRVGRGLFNTYHAEYPLLRYPLDHVFVSPGTQVAGLQRVRVPGSDHFGMLARLWTSPAEPLSPDADPQDHREAQALIDEGQQDAQNVDATSNQ